MSRCCLMVLLLAACLSGCQDNSAAERSSAEHVVPPHWPANLEDAADKIRQRAAVLRTADAARDESHKQLRDIVGWVPEVAADTELSEQDWLPIYHASESLSTRLRGMPGQFDALTFAEIESYCQLLEDRARLLAVDTAAEAETIDSTSEGIENGDTPAIGDGDTP